MNLEKPSTCEDCLSFLISKNKLDKSDVNILKSINKQITTKNVAMTDRQYALVKGKLLNYKRTFQEYGIDMSAINELKFPLREIDRSHWIKILKYRDEDVLGIRFPFNKKVIDRIEDLRRLNEINIKAHTYADNVHCFPLTPQNIYKVVDIANRFNTKFSIHQDVIDIWHDLDDYTKHKEDHIPGVYDLQLKNIPDNAKESIENDLGKVDMFNLALYYDRRYLYNLEYFDMDLVKKSMQNFSVKAQKLINRDNSTVLVNSQTVNMNELLPAFLELNRTPLLVVLPTERAHDKLTELHQIFRNLIPREEMSVMFRLMGTDPFNTYVKDEKLNNSVDKNTKIVYISNIKLPKPLLKADWTPTACLSFDSTKISTNNVSMYCADKDLHVVYDDMTTSSGIWIKTERKYLRANV